MLLKIGADLSAPLAAAWEPIAPLSFTPARVEASPALVAGFDADEPVVATRFGLSAGEAKPVMLDLLYPMAALKPHAPSLTAKVARSAAQPDAGWRQGLTRAAMAVRFPVRSVLAEPVVPLSTLMSLKPGDVIPISMGAQAPVMVGGDVLGMGTVGVSNGRAAVKLERMTRLLEDL